MLGYVIYVCGNSDAVLSGFFDNNRKKPSKEHNLFEIEIFCNVILVKFDRWIASLLNKSINLFQNRTFFNL